MISQGGAGSKFGIMIDLDCILIDAYVANFILLAINIDLRASPPRATLSPNILTLVKISFVSLNFFSVKK